MTLPPTQFSTLDSFVAYLLSQEKVQRGSTYGAFLILYELAVIKGKNLGRSAQAAWKLAESLYEVEITALERTRAVNEYSRTPYRVDMTNEDVLTSLRLDLFGKAAMRATLSGRYP